MGKKKSYKKIKRGKGIEVKNYFDETTQKAIVDYQNCNDEAVKKEICEKYIYPAFSKLVENLIFVYGFHVYDESIKDLKNSCIEFLFNTINKFDPSRGTKAFSYFTIVAKNWLTIRTKNSIKSSSIFTSLEDLRTISNSNGKVEIELISDGYGVVPSIEEVIIRESMEKDIKDIVTNLRNVVETEKEKEVLDAVEIVFNNIYNLDIVNRKAILCYLREITGMPVKQLSQTLSQIRRKYRQYISNKKDE